VLLVGNNPIELGRVTDHLTKLKGKLVEIEIAFDLLTMQQRLPHFQPDFIVIDDNIGKAEIKDMIQSLLHDKRTREVPITILKNSNYIETIGSGALNFILKDALTGDSLYKALLHSLQFKRTQKFLYESYRKRKGQLQRLFKKQEPVVQM